MEFKKWSKIGKKNGGHAHTHVYSQRSESSSRTGSHGVPAGEAESTYFWNLPMDGGARDRQRKSEKGKDEEKKTHEQGVVGRGNRHSKTEMYSFAWGRSFNVVASFQSSMMWTDSKINVDKLFNVWMQEDWDKHLPES